MKQKIDVVIGAAYGDEGKGLITDWLAREGSAVVRFCGGAQAGHTVQAPDGRRHVFSHFGAGTFREAATVLSPYFVCELGRFQEEWNELRALGSPPRVYVDPACPVTTFYDILLNRLRERARRDARHGSVGLGFGETMRRMEEEGEGVHLTAEALGDGRAVLGYLDRIRTGMLREVDAHDLPINRAGFEADVDRLTPIFLEQASFFVARTIIRPWSDVRAGFDHLVFEGAQGLLLDRDLGAFPHVTRAKTGLVNVAKLLGEEAYRRAHVYFVSRCYLTRHGAGPLPGEVVELPGLNLDDETNRENPWQGRLRVAPLNAEVLAWTISRAMREVRTLPDRMSRVTTCLDQIGPRGIAVADAPTRKEAGWFRDLSHVVSTGPTREHVEVLRP